MRWLNFILLKLGYSVKEQSLGLCPHYKILKRRFRFQNVSDVFCLHYTLQSRSQSPRVSWCWPKDTWALGTRLEGFHLMSTSSLTNYHFKNLLDLRLFLRLIALRILTAQYFRVISARWAHHYTTYTIWLLFLRCLVRAWKLNTCRRNMSIVKHTSHCSSTLMQYIHYRVSRLTFSQFLWSHEA